MRTTTTAGTVLRHALPDPEEPGRVLALMGRVERAEPLDALAEALRRAVRAVPLGKGRDLLHGRWLGHPVHPVLVEVPVGAWISAAVLDSKPGGGRAAGLLVAVGLAGAVPAAAAGLVDWAELERPQARVGLLHAALNVGAVTCYSASLAARLTGHGLRGRAYALAGLCTLGVAAAAGGHLAYRQAAGANHAEDVPHLVPPGWTPVGPLAEIPHKQPVRRMVGEVPVAVVRDGDGSCRALADRCSHDGGPLSEGSVEDGCLQCPWHGSSFRLADGWNATGPATAPQPVFDTRLQDGQVYVRLRTPPPVRH
ncbi:Rieske 2Fe-2S domain-containing protein [Actinacidiphila bryophytorum]|uniref:Ferredoxin, 2Fe-2S n=1 Tax=Actinacidiphila bryophytorum TaxID=1436133 RepID=A0A9W4MI32_9ACTN|nr:Ferredoxin, 2Fe-2S [Actinacidiphila bryophytorum]